MLNHTSVLTEALPLPVLSVTLLKCYQNKILKESKPKSKGALLNLQDRMSGHAVCLTHLLRLNQLEFHASASPRYEVRV